MESRVVVVGTSLGGFDALKVLLSGLPREFPLPIVVAQHRGKTGDEALARSLGRETALCVCEPDDKEPLESGHVYLAPADYHLLVELGFLALSTDAPVGFARPSIDVLFESAAQAYGRGVIGVILTGANADGASGAARIKERGGIMLVQDPESAESNAMPAATIAATHVDKVLPLSELSSALIDLCSDGSGVAHE